MRFTEMRLMEWVGGAVAIAGFAMSAQTASAQACDYNYDSTCVQRVDLVVVSGTNNGPGYGQYDPYAGGGSSGGGPQPLAESPSEKVIKAAKTSPKLCKKASETCAEWGQRMKAPFGETILDGNGIPTGVKGTGFYPSISTIIPIVGQAVCNAAVNMEVAVEGCVNVTCP